MEACQRAPTLREIDVMEDPRDRRQAMLDRLDEDRSIALNRTRQVAIGKGESVECPDPDVNAAIKADSEACALLAIEPVKPGPSGSLLGNAFERKPQLVKGTG